MDIEDFFNRQMHRSSSAEALGPEAAEWLVERFMLGFVEHRTQVPPDRARAAYHGLADSIAANPSAWLKRMYLRMQRYDPVVATAWLGAVSEGLRDHQHAQAARACWRLRQRLLSEAARGV